LCDILSLICVLADRGRKLKPLGKVETEDGEITNVVTDMPFMDMIISPTGSVLPLTTPPGFFEKHEAELIIIDQNFPEAVGIIIR
jgi:hypothetical protein